MIPTTFLVEMKDGSRRIIEANSRSQCEGYIGKQCINTCRPATNAEIWDAAIAHLTKENAGVKRHKRK